MTGVNLSLEARTNFDRAAAEILERGIGTGLMMDSTGRVCGLAALALSLGLMDKSGRHSDTVYTAMEGTEELAVLCGLLDQDNVDYVYTWNDKHPEAVLDVFLALSNDDIEKAQTLVDYPRKQKPWLPI